MTEVERSNVGVAGSLGGLAKPVEPREIEQAINNLAQIATHQSELCQRLDAIQERLFGANSAKADTGPTPVNAGEANDLHHHIQVVRERVNEATDTVSLLERI